MGRVERVAIANPDRVPGTQSRWSAGKDLSFTPLRPERVLEVDYDHMEGRRFRHTAQFKRWRTDRDPESCGYEQLEEPVGYDLGRILSRRAGPEASTWLRRPAATTTSCCWSSRR